MRRIYTLLVAASMLAACSKKSNTPVVPYNVTGIQDVSVTDYYDSAVLAISVNYTTGAQQPVTLTVSGLPPGVTASPTSISGTPSFNGAIHFIATDAAAGTYHITITATSASNTSKTYTFNLVVTYVGMKAKIGGVPFSGMCIATQGNGHLEVIGNTDVNGIAAYPSLSFFLGEYAGNTGTFVIVPNSQVNQAGSNTATSGLVASYGTINITSITSTTVTGTFSFTCTDSTKITDGSFTAPFSL